MPLRSTAPVYYPQGIVQSASGVDVPVRQNWWLDPPPGFRPFEESASLLLDVVAVPLNTETTVLEFTSPIGMGGVLKGVVAAFVGTGFIPGSGDLTWRVKVNGNPVDGYGALISPLGLPEFVEQIFGGIVFGPRSVISITITNTNIALSTGYTVVRLAGYYVPEVVIGTDYVG